MKILFIGGTGIISSACSELSIKKGNELFILNRGNSVRVTPEGALHIKGDIRNPSSIKALLRDYKFDSVVDWIAFTPEHVKTYFKLFRDITSQYIFISSASVYHKPPIKIPITENEPLYNPFWQYSRDKIACENFLFDMSTKNSFPVTVVRPSHTYNRTLIPLHGEFTALSRLLKGKKSIIHGEGTSLWTLTHNTDFAVGLMGILGNEKALGEAFHITGDEYLTWDQICNTLAHELGVEPDIIHIPSEFISRYDSEWGDSLLGDKSHSLIFDNSKIKKFSPDFKTTVPFSEGAKEIVSWFMKDKSRQVVDTELDRRMDIIAEDFIKRFS